MPIAIDQVAALPLFKGLSTVELEEVASYLELDTRPAKTAIIKEGDPPGHPIYVLLAGNVEVVKFGIDRRDHVISTLAAPSVFGEIEVLARRPAIASVVAVSPVNLAVLKRGTFDELCAQNRACILKIIKNIAQTLSYRLAATDERLAAYFSAGRRPEDKQALGEVRNLLYSTWH